MLRNNKGFTLVEMLIVTSVFVVILMLTSESFKTILKHSSKLVRSEESNIEGVIGLEMMRHDLQQAGYGLFTEPLCAANAYTGEAASAPASTYNEVARNILDPCLSPPANAAVAAVRLPPRAVVAGNNLAAVLDSGSADGNTIIADSDYLVLRGLTLGRSKASQKWTNLTKPAASILPHVWTSDSENLAASDNDKVLLMRRKVTKSATTLSLVPEPTNGWFYIPFSNAAFSSFSTNYGNYILYGLDNASTPRMAFNRSDYFVSRPTAANVPQVCAPNVGTLYKANVNQSDGKLNYLPILDCVADMQVVFGWDLKIVTAASTLDGQDGLVDTWSSPDPNFRMGSASLTDLQAAMADPELLRSSLKVIKVYILAQDGRKDTSYTSPSPIVVGDIDAGETALTKSYDLTAAGLQNYRWKVYRVIVRPKNLTSNQ